MLHLQGGEERQRLPLLSCHAVDVAWLLCHLLQLYEQFLPVFVELVLRAHHHRQPLLPRSRPLCADCQYRRQREEYQKNDFQFHFSQASLARELTSRWLVELTGFQPEELTGLRPVELEGVIRLSA